MHLVIGGSTAYSKTASGTTLTGLTTPTGVTAKEARPCFAKYRRKTVINGRFSNGVCWHDNLSSLTKLGITAPTGAPTIASGGGSGITATSITAYYTFVHEAASVLIQESNPSPISNTLSSLTNGSIAYSTIDAAGEARVTHVYIYRSDNGSASYKFDKKITIGTTSTSSTVPTLSLGTALPQLSSGAVDVYARGVPPFCVFCEVYHDRMWYAGDPSYPQRVWYSRLAEPESVDNRAVGGDYFDTRDGEAITGIKKCGDQLVVFTAKSTYVIQGYSDGVDGTGPPDFTMVKIAPSIGCISHFSIVNVGNPSGGDVLWFAAQDGIWAYNGSSFRFLMNNLRSDWRDDYLANKTSYESSCASFDHFFNVYKLLISETSTSFYYIGHALGMQDGGDPDWTFDVRARRDSFTGNLANSSNLFESYTGSCDGKIRKENQMDVGDDDGVDKEVEIRHKHYYFSGIGGGVNHGHTFTDADLYTQSENTAFNFDFFAGDTWAGEAVTPQKTIPVAASAVSTFAIKDAHFTRLDKVSGRGITGQVRSTNPIGLEHAGFGISWHAGTNSRLKVT